MIKQINIFIASSIFLLLSCNGGISSKEKDRIIKEYNDSIALAERGKEDSIRYLVPDIKVNIFVRTEVGYDSEGWPLEMGRLDLVKDFQTKKEYQLKGYDYIEKIEIVGKSNDVTLQFINGNSQRILHEERAITLNGTKKYTSSDPMAEKDKYYQDWLVTKWDPLIIKIAYKNESVFEGKISPSKK